MSSSNSFQRQDLSAYWSSFAFSSPALKCVYALSCDLRHRLSAICIVNYIFDIT